MKAELKSIDSTRQEISIIIPWEDVAADYEKFLKKFARKIELPGFRKGKVPTSRVEKMYAQNIEYDFINEKFYTYYYDSVKETDAKPVSEPSISKLEFKKGEQIELAVEFDFIPEWTLPKLGKSIKVEKINYQVADDDIAEAMEKLRVQHAEVKTIDEVTKNSNVEVNSYDLTVKGNKSKKTEKVENITVGKEPYDGEIGEALIGGKVGDTIEVTLKGQGKDATDLKRCFDIKKIEEHVLPELNDEFAQTIDETSDTLAEFQVKYKKDMENYWKNESDKKMQMDIINALVAAADTVKIPDSLVNSYLDDIRESREKQYNQTIEAEEFNEANRKDASDQIKWQLIRDQIKKDEKITASEEEINAKIDTLMEKLPEENKDVYRKYYEGEQMKNDLVHQVEDAKIFDFINSKISLKNKKVKYSDFAKGNA